MSEPQRSDDATRRLDRTADAFASRAVLPSLDRVRDAVCELTGRAPERLDLGISYVKLTDAGPALFLFECGDDETSRLYICGQILTAEKGRRLEASLNSAPLLCGESPPATRRRRVALYANTLGMLLQVFPDDRRLPSLAVAADESRVATLIGAAPHFAVRGSATDRVRIRVMRYKPHRKCVFRYRLDRENGELPVRTVYAKVARQKDFVRTSTYLSRIRAVAGTCPLRFPVPLGCFASLCLELFSEIPGRPLSDLCGSGKLGEACTRVARMLHRFHSLPVDMPVRWNRMKQSERLAKDTRSFEFLLPEDKQRTGDLGALLAERLRSLPDASPSLIHRDFHGMNVILHGDDIGLIDLEDSALGDASEDIGSMYAYLTRLSLERPRCEDETLAARSAFVDAYPRIPVSDDTVAVHSAMYCYFQALQQLRHPCVARRLRHVDGLLGECDRILEHGIL